MYLTIYAILFGLLTSYFFPQSVGLQKALPYVLMLMLFFTFLSVEFRPAKFFNKKILGALIVMYGVLPLIVHKVTGLIHLNDQVSLGLFLVAITPAAMAAPTIAEKSGLDKEIVISSVVVSNLLSPLSYTLLFSLYYHSSMELSFLPTFTKVMAIIAIPMIAALLLKRTKHKFKYINITKDIGKASSALLFLLISLAVISVGGSVFSGAIEYSTIFQVFVITLLLSGTIYYLNYLVGVRFSRHWSKSFSLVLGHKNTGLAMGLIPAMSLSDNPLVALPILLYLVSHHIHNSILINIYKNKDNNKFVDKPLITK